MRKILPEAALRGQYVALYFERWFINSMPLNPESRTGCPGKWIDLGEQEYSSGNAAKGLNRSAYRPYNEFYACILIFFYLYSATK
ncbi:MAG: hypothetical protein QNK37_17915 [Acidobacteriota bacterium]|nr:hypothetical protein [Acidobacteriota bacterium]